LLTGLASSAVLVGCGPTTPSTAVAPIKSQFDAEQVVRGHLSLRHLITGVRPWVVICGPLAAMPGVGALESRGEGAGSTTDSLTVSENCPTEHLGRSRQLLVLSTIVRVGDTLNVMGTGSTESRLWNEVGLWKEGPSSYMIGITFRDHLQDLPARGMKIGSNDSTPAPTPPTTRLGAGAPTDSSHLAERERGRQARLDLLTRPLAPTPSARMTLLIRGYLGARFAMTSQRPVLLICDATILDSISVTDAKSLKSAFRLVDSVTLDPECRSIQREALDAPSVHPVVSLRSITAVGETTTLRALAQLNIELVQSETAVFRSRDWSLQQLILGEWVQSTLPGPAP
jgi:hypothetical protein